MEDNINNILQSLIEQARKNKDNEATYDLIGIASNSEQVRSFTNQLENKGLITDVSIFGKTSFSCKVTEKGLEYFEKEKLNEN